jgi:hypothetical protein
MFLYANQNEGCECMHRVACFVASSLHFEVLEWMYAMCSGQVNLERAQQPVHNSGATMFLDHFMAARDRRATEKRWKRKRSIKNVALC